MRGYLRLGPAYEDLQSEVDRISPFLGNFNL